jgi:protein-L-isoaspartate(D-aspartate) O-methyltransferase
MINFSERRQQMVGRQIEARGVRSQKVLDAMGKVPREFFLPEDLREFAYEDSPLPLEAKQTISQPYIVARMTEILLENGVPDVVLEVGTGSGYQSAILSRLVPKVYTVERISALLQKAREAHRKLGLMNVFSKHSDGSWGWAPNAPYQAIMVTAAPKTVPPGLLEQLAVGGRMIIPVGSLGGVQELKLYTRTAEGVEEKTLELVSFVPLLDGAVR